jgi:hypothetical protein
MSIGEYYGTPLIEDEVEVLTSIEFWWSAPYTEDI